MAKRARKTKKQQHQNQTNDVISVSAYRRRQKHVQIIPKNLLQEDYLEMLDDANKAIVFAMGPAGTGKTMLGVLAAIDAMQNRQCEKIVITRPAVSVDEQHGFLPGTLVEKMAPWTRPIFDVMEEYWSPKEIENMIEENVIEIAPLAYMRGRTFKDSWIIADEMQNATDNQMKMLLTRIGDGSKLVVTGDLDQHDRGFESNGLKCFIQRLIDQGSDRSKLVQFEKGDVERHPIVAEVLKLYGDS